LPTETKNQKPKKKVLPSKEFENYPASMGEVR
jgi:hypothetical protein